MEERIKEIKNDIQKCLNKGYDIDELKEIDKAEVSGFIWAIYNTENAFNNLPCFMDESIRGKIAQEEAEETWEQVYSHLISSAVCLVYSIMDNDESYHEK